MGYTQPPPDFILYHDLYSDWPGTPRAYYVIRPGRLTTGPQCPSTRAVLSEIRQHWVPLGVKPYTSIHHLVHSYGVKVTPRPLPEGKHVPTYNAEDRELWVPADCMPKPKPPNERTRRKRWAEERKATRPRDMVLWYRASPTARRTYHVRRPDFTVTPPLFSFSEVRRELNRAWEDQSPAPRANLDYVRSFYGLEVHPVPAVPGLEPGRYYPARGWLVLHPDWTPPARPAHDPRKPPAGVRFVQAPDLPTPWRVDARTGLLEPVEALPSGTDRRRVRTLRSEPLAPGDIPHADFARGVLRVAVDGIKVSS